MEHPDVLAELTDAALEGSPALVRFYLQGGGSLTDLRTDLSHALAAVAVRCAELRDTDARPAVVTIDLREHVTAVD